MKSGLKASSERHKLLKNVLHNTVAFYLVLAAVILYLCLMPGYIIVLDMVFTPNITLSAPSSPSFAFYLLLKVLSFIFPVWLLQKIILVSAFVLAGVGAHKLVAYALKTKKPTAYGAWPYYFAGILYMVNPFTYTRLMAGQFAVLLGYALLPFVARYGIMFLHGANRKTALKLAFMLVAVSIVSIHTFGLALILLACLAISGLAFNRPAKAKVLHTAKYAGLGFLAFCVLSSYWLVPLATGNSSLSDTVGGFSSQDAEAFATTPGDIGLTLNVLALQGFWGDDKNLYLLPQDNYALWLAPVVLLWALVLVGIYYGFKKSRVLSTALLAAGVLGFVLAVGTAGTIFAPLNEWLLAHVPFYTGYREPQKFAALLALAYAFFGAYGVAFIVQKLRIKIVLKNGFIAVCLLLPIACAPLMPFAANGQLKATEYPQDWYQINTYLKQNASNTKTLFLPWHLYMPFGFTDRVIANPATKFFETEILASKNPEIGNANSYATDPTTKKLDILLPAAAFNPNLAQDLRDLGVGYIILAKGYNYKKYEYLNSKPGITVEQQTENLVLYKVNAE